MLYSEVFPSQVVIAGGQVISRPLYQVENLVLFFPYMLIGYLLQFHGEILTLFRKRTILTAVLCVAVIALAVIAVDALYDGENVWTTKFILTMPLSILLWMAVRKLPPHIGFLEMLNKYALQIMFLDSFYKIILFKLFARVVPINNILIVALIAAIDIGLSCLTCRVVERIPVANRLIGL